MALYQTTYHLPTPSTTFAQSAFTDMASANSSANMTITQTSKTVRNVTTFMTAARVTRPVPAALGSLDKLDNMADQKGTELPAPAGGDGRIVSADSDNKVDSAVDTNLSEDVKRDLAAKFEKSNNGPSASSLKTDGDATSVLTSETVSSFDSTCTSVAVTSLSNSPLQSPPQSPLQSPPQSSPQSPSQSPPESPTIIVGGIPYSFDRIRKMGDALALARRGRSFPPTTTPNYNLQSIIDDFADLERLNAARKNSKDIRDDAFQPNIACVYTQIQRRIQDRDLASGEVAADSNVRARLGGFANGTGAEATMYNLMRHAVVSVLRMNGLTRDSDIQDADAVTSRVVREIRHSVQTQAALGVHGVDAANMDHVMEAVFASIQDALGNRVEFQADRVEFQADRLDGQINNMDRIAEGVETHMNNTERIANAQLLQVNAIAGHANAINNHVHALGNNVNAMGTLLNGTNGNVTALTTGIGTLQTILNTTPQMVTNSVQEMIPGIMSTAVEQAVAGAFTRAMTNDRISQILANAMPEAHAHAEDTQNTHHQARERKCKWLKRLGIFKRCSSRTGCPTPQMTPTVDNLAQPMAEPTHISIPHLVKSG
ncbi:hypothetical protein F4777DRAFT_593659 [Nemania sp. FL0916]|nr:hypothetical protein F4777DRAFT_593659 [Nemania sp. FL0916]